MVDGVGVGVVVGVEVTVFVDSSSTWRKASCAVAPTRWPTCLAFLCGTETTMSSLPCCTTEAPVKPEPLIRSSMMDLALFIAPWSTVVMTLGRDRFQRDLRTPGQVQAEADLEALVPVAGVAEVAAEHSGEHHDE